MITVGIFKEIKMLLLLFIYLVVAGFGAFIVSDKTGLPFSYLIQMVTLFPLAVGVVGLVLYKVIF